jgi:hypothetical protein
MCAGGFVEVERVLNLLGKTEQQQINQILFCWPKQKIKIQSLDYADIICQSTKENSTQPRKESPGTPQPCCGRAMNPPPQ